MTFTLKFSFSPKLKFWIDVLIYDFSHPIDNSVAFYFVGYADKNRYFKEVDDMMWRNIQLVHIRSGTHGNCSKLNGEPVCLYGFCIFIGLLACLEVHSKWNSYKTDFSTILCIITYCLLWNTQWIILSQIHCSHFLSWRLVSSRVI